MQKLENAYVAYVDVLGFRKLVYENPEKLDRFFEITKKAFSIFDAEKGQIWKGIFSDSIIFVVDHGENNFKAILKATRNLQAWLSSENIWTRGAISFGNVCLDNWGNERIMTALLPQIPRSRNARDDVPGR